MTVFDEIYRTNAWNGIETRSGPGSGMIATRRVAEDIVALVAELGVKSVLDYGCGEGLWMPDLPGYVGIDVSWAAIARAQAFHPDRTYYVDDRQYLPRLELVIIRDVIQHLPSVMALGLLTRAVLSGARWLLASTYQGGENVEIMEGEAYSPDLMAEPFNLWKPERLIFDGYHYHETEEARDPRKFLGLWDLHA